MVHDIELMHDMGQMPYGPATIRMTNVFWILCDERGLLVWEENHARGLSLEQMKHPLFAKQARYRNREMLESHFNHPSIIIWAILNECASDTPEGREMYRTQLEQIRAMDTSRPLSFASHHRDRELCFDLADIVSFNLYPLWYEDEDPQELVKQARLWADQAGGLGKPMIMSEFGADGYYGYRYPSRVKRNGGAPGRYHGAQFGGLYVRPILVRHAGLAILRLQSNGRDGMAVDPRRNTEQQRNR